VSNISYIDELVGRAPLLAFAKDVEGRYLYVNGSWLAVVGLTQEQVVGRTDHELFPHHIADGFVSNDRQVLETGVSVDVEEIASRGDEVRVGHCTKFPLRDAAGTITGVGGIAIDITERHLAHKALQRSEARYRELFEHSPEAYVLLDPASGHFVDANLNACTLFKVSREQLMCMGPAEVSPVTQADGRSSEEAAGQAVFEALAGKTPVFDWIHQAGDGELLPCRIWLSRVELDTGLAVRASILDMREIERVRSVLERTRAQLDAVQDAMPQLVAVFDPVVCKMVHCNRTYRRYLGDAAPIQLWEAAAAACEQAARDGRARQELELANHRGRVRAIDVDVSVFQRDAAGVATRLLLVGTDVTEQRELEAQLRQSRRLESLGRLAGGVAHDFNNLLTVILGSAEFLAPALNGDAEVARDLSALKDAALQAQTLTSQLLAFARADEGRVEPVEVDELVAGSVRMLKRLIGEDVEIDLSLSAPGQAVKIDKGQLQQTVVNLAVNARDAMPKGGKLRITTELVSVPEAHGLSKSLRPGSYLEVTFQDTGTGMSQAVAEIAFEPFFTTKPRGEGTGLGLSTVHGVVKRAGGHAVIQSRVGEGTTVRLWIPSAGRVVQRAEAVPRAQLGGGGRVLLVEDDMAVCAVSARALKGAGYDVTAANSPADALALVESGKRFDAIVSDVMMPGMSGLELVDRLAPLLGSVPVLFVSGYAEDVLEERGVEASDIELLKKPFSPSTLVERLASLFRN
jgi:PAS domain S-box-containing protein